MHDDLRQRGLAVEDGTGCAEDLDDMCVFCCDISPDWKRQQWSNVRTRIG